MIYEYMRLINEYYSIKPSSAIWRNIRNVIFGLIFLHNHKDTNYILTLIKMYVPRSNTVIMNYISLEFYVKKYSMIHNYT